MIDFQLSKPFLMWWAWARCLHLPRELIRFQLLYFTRGEDLTRRAVREKASKSDQLATIFQEFFNPRPHDTSQLFEHIAAQFCVSNECRKKFNYFYRSHIVNTHWSCWASLVRHLPLSFSSVWIWAVWKVKHKQMIAIVDIFEIRSWLKLITEERTFSLFSHARSHFFPTTVDFLSTCCCHKSVFLNLI